MKRFSFFKLFSIAIFTIAPLFLLTSCGKSETKCKHSNTTEVIVVEPTCYSQGEKAYLCQDCGMYTGEFFINGLTHNYVELTSEYVASTCTTDGKRVYECTLCKDRHWDYVSPLDHVFTDKTVVQSADCNQIGIETEICSRCNETTRKEIPKTIHDYETMVIRESTCYSTGEIKYVCKNCGQSTTAYTNKISHSYVDYSITKEPTCTEYGLKVSTCSVCGNEESWQIAKTTHEYGDWEIKVLAKCDEKGQMYRKCKHCDDYETKDINPTNHTYGEDYIDKAATCTEDGTKVSECTKCGVKKYTTIKATGHTLNEETIVKNATCAEAGLKTITCKNCDYHEDTLIPVLNHSYSEYVVTKEPTCVDLGEKTSTCSGCGDQINAPIATSGHSLGEEYVVQEATCSEHKIVHQDCANCDYVKETIKEILPHLLDDGVITKEVTCTASGEITYSCAKCDYTEKEVIASTGHTYNDGVVTKEATCTEKGSTKYTCTKCLASYDKDIAIIAHTPAPNGEDVAPTCYNDGITYGTHCSVCNLELKGDKTITKLTHYYENHACNKCGKIEEAKYEFFTDDPTISYEPMYVEYGTPVENLPVPEVPGKAFLYWYEELTLAEFVEGSIAHTSRCLHAKWDTLSLITTKEQLMAIADNPSITYYLANDINMRGEQLPTISEFTGTLDGKGYKIYNFLFQSPSVTNYAFITNNKGTLRNINFVDFSFSGAGTTPQAAKSKIAFVLTNNGTISNVTMTTGTCGFAQNIRYDGFGNTSEFTFAGLVATNNGLIDKCSINCDFTVLNNTTGGSYAAETTSSTTYFSPICAINETNGVIKNSNFTGKITVTTKCNVNYNTHHVKEWDYIGAIAGINKGKIASCYANSSLNYNGQASGWTRDNASGARGYVGILVGSNQSSGKISMSYTVGSMKGYAYQSGNYGSFVGLNTNQATIISCYSNANAEGNGSVGGFAGYNNSSIQNSYATGKVYSSTTGNFGGFVGANSSSGLISKAYSTGSVTSAGGKVGRFVGSSDGTYFNCYNLKNSVCEGVTNPTSPMDVEELTISELVSPEFLLDTLYWDQEGFFIGNSVDTDPLLKWELERGHNFIVTKYYPTCETIGFTTYVCQDEACNKIIITDFIVALGHEYHVDEANTYDSSCSKKGRTTYVCDRVTYDKAVYSYGEEIDESTLNTITCDGTYYQEFDKLSHTPTINTTTGEIDYISYEAPTCENDGSYSYICSECHGTISGNVIPALGHNPKKDINGEIIIIDSANNKAATCSEFGVTTYFCTNECHNANYEVALEKLDHTPTIESYLSPSCSLMTIKSCEDDNDYPTIEVNGDHYKIGYYKATDGYTSCYWLDVYENDGIYTCTINDYKFVIETIDNELPHILINGFTYIRLTRVGHKAGMICEECGEILEGVEPLYPHDYVEEAIDAATCTEAGLSKFTCETCKKSYEEVIPALGHIDSNLDGHCDRCDEETYSIDASFIKISTIADLRNISKSLYSNYYLANDIDLDGVEWTPIGTSANPFLGIFDGCGYQIKNLKFDFGVMSNVEYGLFGYNAGTIRRLTINGASLSASSTENSKIGLISVCNTSYKLGSKMYKGQILDCQVTGTIYVYTVLEHDEYAVNKKATYDNVFGVITAVNYSIIKNVIVSGTVTHKYGVLTELSLPKLSDIRTIVKTPGIEDNVTYTAGGIAGINYGSIDNANVTGTFDSKNILCMVNIIGIDRGKVTLVIRSNEGSLVGINKEDGTITNSTATKATAKYSETGITKDETIRTLWNSVIYKASATYINTSSYEATDHLGYVGINYNTNANALDYTTLSE